MRQSMNNITNGTFSTVAIWIINIVPRPTRVSYSISTMKFISLAAVAALATVAHASTNPTEQQQQVAAPTAEQVEQIAKLVEDIKSHFQKEAEAVSEVFGEFFNFVQEASESEAVQAAIDQVEEAKMKLLVAFMAPEVDEVAIELAQLELEEAEAKLEQEFMLLANEDADSESSVTVEEVFDDAIEFPEVPTVEVNAA